MAQLPAIQFLKRAVVQDKDTWFCIHHKFDFGDGRLPIFPGNAHQDIRHAWNDALFWARKKSADVYLAQGAFLEPGEHNLGGPYLKAKRQIPNLAGCKNLYMDVDVGKKGAYQTQQDAFRACGIFIRKSGIPDPTIIVDSGSGGLHLYWTLNEIFSEKNFREMAQKLTGAALQHGLLFDRQCTNDPVHLFRIPGTWNFKGLEPGEPGREVKLLRDTGTDIDRAVMEAALKPFSPVSAAGSHSQSYNLRSASSNSEAAALNEDLSGDMDANFPKANIDEVAKHCPFLKETLEAGGANLSGDWQWHDMAALSCHCDDPSQTMHRLCGKHQSYDHDKTEEKLATALRAREQRTEIGPPKCATLQTNGAKQCEQCPHLSLGTTPLSVGYKQRRNAVGFVTASAAHPDLPDGYFRGGDGLIYKSTPNNTAGDTLAFEYQIEPWSGFIEAGEAFRLHFTTYQGEQSVPKAIEMGVVANQTRLIDALSNTGLTITRDRKETMSFLMSYTKLLQSKRETTITAPAMGWSFDNTNGMGFAYAGEFVTPDGTFKCKLPTAAFANYNVMGDTAVWRDLTAIVLTPDRPDLCVMAATSFGAPLVKLTGEEGVLLGIWSPASGIGKTTSLKIGQAVWAPPVLSGFNDTINYTFNKAGQLRHLPLIYDEIKGDKQVATFCEIVMQLTGGHEKGRSGRSGDARVILTFETNVDYAANKSVVAAVRETDKGTDALWLRMFEMEAIATSGSEDFDASVGQQLGALKQNYGGIGRQYATFLGQNQEAIIDKHAKLQATLTNWLKPTRDQRFWIVAMSTTILGAMLANEQGYCVFPLKEMTMFMAKEFRRMQQEMLVNSGNFNTDATIVNIITAFLNEKRPRNMLILDKTQGQGRPSKNYAQILNGQGRYDNQWGPFHVQVSGDPLTVKISDVELTAWCKLKGFPKGSINQALKTRLGARTSSITIGSGSRLAQAKENNGWVIVTPNTPLDDAMEEYRLNYEFKP